MGDAGTILNIRAWPDALVDARGFAPTSAYVEWAWLPIIGPTTTCAYRRLASGLDASPDGYEVNVPELADSLGMSGCTGCGSSIMRTTARLVAFGLARWENETTLAVLRKAPSLAGRHRRACNTGLSSADTPNHDAA